MSDTPANASTDASRTRLFAGICLALIPTGASFALIGNVLGQLKEEFLLTNQWVGQIAGAGVSGMALSLLVLGPLLEGFGMKKGTMAAFAGHLVGLVLMLAAAPFAGTDAGFWLLMLGSFVLAMGHGMIEVSGNPLTAALYPEDKSTKLNWFHAFFPIGIVAGSLIGFGLNTLGGPLSHWTFQLGIILIPVIIYGVMVLPQEFPKTENAEAGLPVGEMFRNTFTSPLMYLMLVLMAIPIAIELGAGRWIPEVFARVGVEGILLMTWASIIMVVLRMNAAFFINLCTPPGLLAISAVFLAAGLYCYGTADGTAAAFLGATFFGVGVSFFFPTTVGIVAERLPQTGSLGIVLTCGVGLGAAGQIGTPGVGLIGDMQIASYLSEEDREERAVAVLEGVQEEFPAYVEQAEQADNPIEEVGFLAADVQGAIGAAEGALADYREAGDEIVGNSTPQALRAVTGSGVSGDDEPLVADAAELLDGAEGYGGQRALLLISWLPLTLLVVYGAMYLNDKRKGGYQAVRLETAESDVEVPHEGSVPPEYQEELTVAHDGGDGAESDEQRPQS